MFLYSKFLINRFGSELNRGSDVQTKVKVGPVQAWLKVEPVLVEKNVQYVFSLTMIDLLKCKALGISFRFSLIEILVRECSQ